MSTKKSSTWRHVVTSAAHHQSHSGNYVTSLIAIMACNIKFMISFLSVVNSMVVHDLFTQKVQNYIPTPLWNLFCIGFKDSNV